MGVLGSLVVGTELPGGGASVEDELGEGGLLSSIPALGFTFWPGITSDIWSTSFLQRHPS